MAKKNDPDLFEEFEFRPLSTGLGFHKRNDSSAGGSDPSGTTALVKMPLPRNQAAKTAESPLVDNLKAVYQEKASQRIKQNRIWDIDDKIIEPFTAQPTAVKGAVSAEGETAWRKSFFDLTALLIDTVIVSAVFMISLALMHLTAGIDVLSILAANTLDQGLIIAMVVLLAAIGWLYMVSSRAAAGQTAGEFIFDHRLGLPEQYEESSYVWRMCLRTTLMFATGFSIFPLIEEITGKDLLAKLLNLQHYRKVNIGPRTSK
jgi:hypothetical protein